MLIKHNATIYYVLYLWCDLLNFLNMKWGILLGKLKIIIWKYEKWRNTSHLIIAVDFVVFASIILNFHPIIYFCELPITHFIQITLYAKTIQCFHLLLNVSFSICVVAVSPITGLLRGTELSLLHLYFRENIIKDEA